MPQLIKPGDVKILTKDGEMKISISLDLNINLNDLANLAPSVKKDSSEVAVKTQEKIEWAIPDFAPAEKINFGK